MWCPLISRSIRKRHPFPSQSTVATAAITLSSFNVALSTFVTVSSSSKTIQHNAFSSHSIKTSSSHTHCRHHHHHYQKNRPIHRMSLSTLQNSQTANNDTASSIETIHPVLPFVNHSHNSAKIVIPTTTDDSTISPEDDFYSKESISQNLESTISVCREMHKSSLWIEVPMGRASLMEIFEQFGFQFHHAHKSVASLCLWLNEDLENKIPEYATHQVGVGAVVINPQNEILCVRELRKNYFAWKIPGGLAELGEHIDEAVIREVYEETGIKTEFQSILAVRHSHGLQFGRSDLYFTCLLGLPEGSGAPVPVPQEGEIEDAAWVPMEEYRHMIDGKDGSYNGHPAMRQVMKLYDQGKYIQRTSIDSIVPNRKPSPVYHAPL